MAVNGVTSTALDRLRARVTGDVLLPGAEGYDAARTLFNSMYDRRPAVIVQCAQPSDVVTALRFGRELGLPIAVRGGGHGVAGKAMVDGGLVLDLRRMHEVEIDPGARTARVGGGATMSHLDRAAEPYGLVTTGGRVSTTGVGGFLLGGGTGWLDRKFGLACDNLLSVDLVTADGTRVTASESEHPELFWALHGGGGNFGVATSFTLQLYPLPVLTVILGLWPPDRGPQVVRAFRDLMAEAGDDVSGGVIYLTAPPEPFVPEELVDRLACGVLVVYTGREEAARRAAAPLLELEPAGSMIEEMPNAELESMIDDPPGYRNYWSVEHLDSLPDDAVRRFCARADDMLVPSPTQHALFPQGGAAGRSTADYPLPWRHARWAVHPFCLWEDPADDERSRRWAHAVREDVRPWASGAVYLNFVGDEGRDRIVAGLGERNYRRLAAVKAHWDPENVFRLNHNIQPAAADGAPGSGPGHQGTRRTAA
ncbi:FAD-binding oxidoreductase [Streptomyces sp. JJ38]|uniref:FAD-binding oxidoreductase n=1 Tax=Streptomyces sp. JJ38 TaxID=2738128 RepID=UPI001C56B5B5|nr:FAD-binding oxidoreductase [Streptomyces sp. JJ38]MBW1596503.1 FAD-binding oxidoreductase [Streptomyces sp. JJ38]